MDLKSVVLGPAAVAAFDFVDKGNPERELPLPGHLTKEGPVRGGEQTREGHPRNLDALSKYVNTRRIGHFVEAWDDLEMEFDAFPKRGLFREWVAEAKAKLGVKTNAEVAPIMGYAPSSLNKMLGKSATHKPGDDAMMLLGDFLGRDWRLLLKDSEKAPEGISQDLWAKLSSKKRIIATGLLTDLAEIPEDVVDDYLELWERGIRIGLRRMESEEKRNNET